MFHLCGVLVQFGLAVQHANRLTMCTMLKLCQHLLTKNECRHCARKVNYILGSFENMISISRFSDQHMNSNLVLP